MNVTHLECSLCRKKFEAGKIHNLCDCGGPLLVRYDLAKIRQTWNRQQLAKAPANMWRYAPVLPPPGIGCYPGRRHDSSNWRPSPPEKAGRPGPLGQRRRAEPYRVIQSAGTIVRRLDGSGAGDQETSHSLCGQRGECSGCLCRCGRHRGAHLHAARCSAIELHRVPRVRRARDSGRRPDQRLRQNRQRRRRGPRAGSTSPRSRSRIASKARKRWATRRPSR